jgi:hypothetical protein
MASLKMTGDPELERALRELGGQVAGRLGQNAVSAGARVIAADARRRVPCPDRRVETQHPRVC